MKSLVQYIIERIKQLPASVKGLIVFDIDDTLLKVDTDVLKIFLCMSSLWNGDLFLYIYTFKQYMKSLVQYINEDNIVNLLEELINNKQIISEDMISDNDIIKLFESNELNFEPKNKEELESLFKKISNHKDVETDIIDAINDGWIKFVNKHFSSIKDKMPFKLLGDVKQSYRNALLIDSIIISYPDMDSSSTAH